MDKTILNNTENNSVKELKKYISIVTTLTKDLSEMLNSYKYIPNEVAIYQMVTHKKLFLINDKYKSSEEFEIQTSLIATLFNNKKVEAITKQLYTAATECTIHYNSNREMFEGYDYIEFYNKWIDSYKKDHFAIYKSDLDYYGQINKEGNSYKYAFRAMEQLLNEKEQERAKYSHYKVNVYTSSYTLVEHIEAILKPYFSGSSTSNNDCTSIIPEQYIHLTYSLCVGKQFEEIPYDIFSNVLNASSISEIKLTIKKGENNRAYYVIHLLQNCVYEQYRKEWFQYILKYLNITESVYNSKYATVNGKKASNKDKDFKKLMAPLFPIPDS